MRHATLLFVAALSACSQPADETVVSEPSSAMRFLSGDAPDGYRRVVASRAFQFPADHGSHDDYQSEWWYFTGNLETDEARHFGFELTFFRFALDPQDRARDSEWGTNQAWMAHLAVTDTEAGRFIAAERFSRGALGLAGYRADPFGIWLEDWSASGPGPGMPPLTLRAATDRVGIRLTLEGGKPPVAHGNDGMDPKGPERGNASHYYSLTRLGASGTLEVDGAEYEVAGSAWMDREWGSSALSPELAGWDWFGLQLADGRELMYYRLRTRDGNTSPYSGGSLVQSNGARISLAADAVSLTPLESWTSPATGAVYPVAWELSVPLENLTLTIRPYLTGQELNLTVRYWEGAVRVTGTDAGVALDGRGYAELTGY